MALMTSDLNMTRRHFVALTAAAASCGAAAAAPTAPLAELGYGDVTLISEPHEAQLRNTHEVLMSLSEDSLLRPFRQMAGQPAPGADLGGWYNYDPDFDWHKDDAGFAPGATFGQWISALARYYAITGSDLFHGFDLIAKNLNRPVEAYLTMAVVYFAICFSLSMLVRRLQAKIAIIR